jgi:acetolactate synthase small subunit
MTADGGGLRLTRSDANADTSDSMEVALRAVRSPEGLLRLVSSLHSHRWPVETLLVETGEQPQVQQITLRIGIDAAHTDRLLGVLNNLVDVIDINLR